MKKIIFAVCLFSMAQVGACSDCVKKMCSLMKKNEFERTYAKLEKSKDSHEYNEGVRAGVRYSINVINTIHPGAQLTLEEYEYILGNTQ